MSKQNGKKILLADVEQPLEPIVLPDGKTELRVHPLNAPGYEILREYEKTGDQMLMYQLAELILPGASAEQIRNLTGRQLSVVIAHASRQIEMVEELIAGKDAPAPAPRKRRSKSTIPSGTPSAG